MWRWIGKWILRVVVSFAVVAGLSFIGDWAIYALHGSPQSSVTVSQFMSIPLKGQKTEFDFLGTSNVACDVALFPHGGEEPCWYLSRHPNQWEDVGTPKY
jgi:hypothetical protein